MVNGQWWKLESGLVETELELLKELEMEMKIKKRDERQWKNGKVNKISKWKNGK